jgi:hypothetical protein
MATTLRTNGGIAEKITRIERTYTKEKVALEIYNIKKSCSNFLEQLFYHSAIII